MGLVYLDEEEKAKILSCLKDEELAEKIRNMT